MDRKGESIVNNKYEDVFITNCVATIIAIVGVLSVQWLSIIIGLGVGMGLYVLGQGIISKREQLTKMDEQLNELRAIRELLEQDK